MCHNRAMLAVMRCLVTTLALCALGAGISCSSSGLTSCRSSTGEADVSRCKAGENCLWVHNGDKSGLFCAATCKSDGTCPSGTSCHSGGASSCATCMDLIDVCE